MKEDIRPHSYQVSIKDRQEANNHKSLLLWFTGLSGSGKSTIANVVEQKLFEKGIKT
ncbi:MAG: adenylyl-sulfate kinase, partial [Flavobacteriaceae bacterium]|nr:adenylyl-sulfate kinase [Flavobacteriaceae bacterium]